MIKIAHGKELVSLRLPHEVIAVVKDAVTVLDGEYGEVRDIDHDDGGYVLIMETKEDLEKLQEIHIDPKTSIAEYTDQIQCSDGLIYTSTLVLLSNDFGIVVVMPLEFLIYTNWAAYLNQNVE